MLYKRLSALRIKRNGRKRKLYAHMFRKNYTRRAITRDHPLWVRREGGPVAYIVAVGCLNLLILYITFSTLSDHDMLSHDVMASRRDMLPHHNYVSRYDMLARHDRRSRYTMLAHHDMVARHKVLTYYGELARNNSNNV